MPAPLSASDVTAMIFPPRPALVRVPKPSAPGKTAIPPAGLIARGLLGFFGLAGSSDHLTRGRPIATTNATISSPLLPRMHAPSHPVFPRANHPPTED